MHKLRKNEKKGLQGARIFGIGVKLLCTIYTVIFQSEQGAVGIGFIISA